MKRKIIYSLIALILATAICAGCIDPTLPVYEKTETEEDGVCVVIDGVKYKEFPRLEWAIDNVDEIIGYAGSYDTVIYGLKNDPNRDFIVLKGYLQDYYGPGLYRTDKNIPVVSVENVDKIVWEYYEVDPNVERGACEQYYTNTIEDKTTIKELFDVLETGKRTQNVYSVKKGSRYCAMSIYLYCSEIPAASFELGVWMVSGRIVYGRETTGYVYMPENLLEKLAGKKIDISEFTEG